MIRQSYDAIVAGGGLLGLSTAHYLSSRSPQLRVLVVEKAPKLLSLTSDSSTGGFRNFYPDSLSMTALANDSIDRLNQLKLDSQNDFEMVQNGYTFLSARPETLQTYLDLANRASANGSGPVRIDSLPKEMPENGIDILTDPYKIRKLFPSVNEKVSVMMRIAKAGYLNVSRLGKYLEKQCLSNNVDFVQANVEEINLSMDKKAVESIRLKNPDNEEFQIDTGRLILAVGPYLKQMGRSLGIDFPVSNELHSRVRIEDPLELIPEKSPFLIWGDDIELPWNKKEIRQIHEIAKVDPPVKRLLEPIPVPGIAGAHLRPLSQKECSGSRAFYGIWTYDNSHLTDTPVYPPPDATLYDTIILRGLSKMIPSLSSYFDPQNPLFSKTKMEIKSGYYCKTPNNTPLLGPVSDVQGLFVCGAVSGFGIMCSQGAGSMVASQVLASIDSKYTKTIPAFESAFAVDRFDGQTDMQQPLRTANQL